MDREERPKDNQPDIVVNASPRPIRGAGDALVDSGLLSAYTGQAAQMAALTSKAITPGVLGALSTLQSSGALAAARAASATAERHRSQLAAMATSLAPLLSQYAALGDSLADTMGPALLSMARTQESLASSVQAGALLSPGLQAQLEALARLPMPSVSWDAVALASAVAADLGIDRDLEEFVSSDSQSAAVVERMQAEGAKVVAGVRAAAPAGVGMLVLLGHLSVAFYLTGHEDLGKMVVALLYALLTGRGDAREAAQWTRNHLDTGPSESGG